MPVYPRFYVRVDYRETIWYLSERGAVRYAKVLHARDPQLYHECYKLENEQSQPIGYFQLKPKDLVLADGRILNWDGHRKRYDDEPVGQPFDGISISVDKE